MRQNRWQLAAAFALGALVASMANAGGRGAGLEVAAIASAFAGALTLGLTLRRN